MDIENGEPLIIGYYPFRAKAQVDRLLCEYLHVNYRDRFFSPDQWNSFKEKEGRDWVIKDLPFLQDGEFTVTGPIAMATYIVEKSGRLEIFGHTIEDQAKVDNIRSKSDLRTAMLAMKCVERQGNCQAQKRPCMAYYWEKKIKPILNIYEEQTQLNPWFLSYVTIVDFVIYEVVNQLEKLFPQEIEKFKKLKTLRDRVGKIPEIEGYERSERAVREYCPLRYFSSFKEEKLKSSRTSSSGISTSSRDSNRSMDLE